MRSEKINKKLTQAIDSFWRWFQEVAPKLATDPENSTLLRELDRRVNALDPKLSWEIGPGAVKPMQLVISPSLDRELREKARAIVARAPNFDNWELHPARQRKDWNYVLELGSDSVPLNVSDWTFVLLKYPDGVREVLLHGKSLPPLSDEERWEAAAITLESILGEDYLLDNVDEFELVDEMEPRFAERERPIKYLRAAVTGAS